MSDEVNNDQTPPDENTQDTGVQTSTEDQSSARGQINTASAMDDSPVQPAAESQPAPTGDGETAEQPAPQGAEQEVLEEHEDFAGLFTPNERVEETLAILDNEDKKLGSILMSNQTWEELESIQKYCTNRILAQQRGRYAVVKENPNNHGYVAVPVDINGREMPIYMTDKERSQHQLINDSMASLRPVVGKGLFEDDQWDNLPKLGDTKIAIGSPNNSTSNDPVLRIRSKLNLSPGKTLPCWGSGINMHVEDPGNLANLALDTRLAAEKVELGINSDGYVYAAPSVYLNSILISHVLENVSRTSLGTVDQNVLRNTLRLTDLEPMALAQAAAIWPDGYNLERPCLTSKGGCGHVLLRKVNLHRTLFVRRSRLAEAHFQHMARRLGNTLADQTLVKQYQDSLRPEVSRLLKVKDDLYLRLWVPSLAEYERIAKAWMDSLNNRARDLIQSNSNETQRQYYLSQATSLSLVMAFAHWIEAVVEYDPESGEDPVVIVSRQTGPNPDLEKQLEDELVLNRMLETFSEDTDVATDIVDGINEFIRQMTMAAVAIPKTVCPKCGMPHAGNEMSNHPHLVMINPIELFFILLRLRIQRAVG